MNDWVIVILHDGLAQMDVAEAASTVFSRQGTRYSVYITQIEKM